MFLAFWQKFGIQIRVRSLTGHLVKPKATIPPKKDYFRPQIKQDINMFL